MHGEKVAMNYTVFILELSLEHIYQIIYMLNLNSIL